MRAHIRDFNWDDLRPDHPNEQPVHLVMAIGPLDGPGSEIFRITICTREAVDALLERDGIVVGRHLLIVSDLNPAKIESFLHDSLRRFDADTWLQLAEKIGRLAYWEFEDYTEATTLT